MKRLLPDGLEHDQKRTYARSIWPFLLPSGSRGLVNEAFTLWGGVLKI
jgi:hypothetical protein